MCIARRNPSLMRAGFHKIYWEVSCSAAGKTRGSQSLVNEGRFPLDGKVVLESKHLSGRNPSLMRAGFHTHKEDRSRVLWELCRNPSLMRAGFHRWEDEKRKTYFTGRNPSLMRAGFHSF